MVSSQICSKFALTRHNIMSSFDAQYLNSSFLMIMTICLVMLVAVFWKGAVHKMDYITLPERRHTDLVELGSS